jgi:ABC-type uncharacterized transport system substrate-binding protein
MIFGQRWIYTRGRLVIVLLTFLGFQACVESGSKHKIVYVNSYHSGFPPSDEITSGVFEKLPADSFEVITYFMDTKRNPSEEFIRKRASELFDSINLHEPDVLIVSDDNALKYLVVPNFRDNPLPIVFCGVNWSTDQYDLSGLNITGILEILPVRDLVQTLKPYYPSMKKLLVLNENTTTSRKTKPLLDTLLASIGMEVTQELVDDFDSWKKVLAETSRYYNIIYLQTRGAIRGWDHDEAIEHIERHINIPLVTCEDFMMPYSVFGVTQVSREQGMVAADKARSILKGTDPSDIPVSRNHMTKIWLNNRIAEKIGFVPDEELLGRATIID